MASKNVVVDGDYCDMVTRFLFSACRLQPTEHDVTATLHVGFLADKVYPGKSEDEFIPLVTGSSAELYIKPMLSCLGDVDMMFYRNTCLAMPVGSTPPKDLPAEFHSRVTVCEIIDSEYPGYVYLKERHLLTENAVGNRYSLVLKDRPAFLKYTRTESDGQLPQSYAHGPAETIDCGLGVPTVDEVECIRCLSWPPQAADWPTRHRNYDWPDSATVDRVVSNGCDVVMVAHPLCKRHRPKWMYQFRLSFSRAEIVLLNSWVQVQQMVYHMLRTFVKTERLTKVVNSSGAKIASNYFIKTLMLWACEVSPRTWWIKSENVVAICVKLLHILAAWLSNAHAPHYFINRCNLVYDAADVELITVQLTPVTESWLSRWFVNNYILKCAQLCPDRVSQLFDDVSMTYVKLYGAVSAVVDWRKSTELLDLWDVYQSAASNFCEYLSRSSLSVASCAIVNNELAKLDLQLSDYFTAVIYLHFALKITQYGCSAELTDLLSIVCGQLLDRRRRYSRYSVMSDSALMFSQASQLMKVVANNSRSIVQLIEIELSKAYLYRALRCKDSESDNDSIYCLANVYLAVLYYATGQYQTAIDHCTLVMRSQDRSQCSLYVVQGELLPKVDDDIENVSGLLVFYQYVRTVVLPQQRQAQHVSVFTAESFAHYLLVRCLPFTGCHNWLMLSQFNETQSYTEHVRDKQGLFVGDLLLFRVTRISPRFHLPYKSLLYWRQQPVMTSHRDINTGQLVELLERAAVERLTAYRQFEVRKFGSLGMAVTTEFEEIYSYKLGDYRRCLEMSTNTVHTLLYPFCKPTAVAAVVFTFPVLIQLLDDDIVSLNALTLVVNRHCRKYIDAVIISQLTLSLYLMTQCQLKLHHPADQLFQTLGCIRIARERHPTYRTLDHLTLKLTERKLKLHLATTRSANSAG